MQRNDKDDYLWWLIIFLAVMAGTSDAQPSTPKRPDTSQAAARAIFMRHDSASGRIGGRSSLRYSHTITEIESPAITTVTEIWTMAPNRVLTRVTMPGAGTTEVGYDGTVG